MRLRAVKDYNEIEHDEARAFMYVAQDRGSPALPAFQEIVHAPIMFDGFRRYLGAVRYQSSLPMDIKELAISRVGALTRCAFEWMHHAPELAKAGVSAEGIDTIRTIIPLYVGSDGEKGLTSNHWAVLRLVDYMTKEINVPDAVFEPVRQLLNEQQMAELILTIAGYNAGTRILVALDIAGLKDVQPGDAHAHQIAS